MLIFYILLKIHFIYSFFLSKIFLSNTNTQTTNGQKAESRKAERQSKGSKESKASELAARKIRDGSGRRSKFLRSFRKIKTFYLLVVFYSSITVLLKLGSKNSHFIFDKSYIFEKKISLCFDINFSFEFVFFRTLLKNVNRKIKTSSTVTLFFLSNAVLTK
jgi:hypothetical protein